MRRWRTPGVLAGIVLCLFLSCGGLGYVFYRSLHVYVETYEPTTSPTLNGSVVDCIVSVHHRIDSDGGDSLVGPPYWFRIDITDATGKVTAARLHSLRIMNSKGHELQATVTRGENTVTNRTTSLYAIMDNGELGPRPSLIADVELVMLGGSMREELTWTLRRSTRAYLDIP